MNPTFRSISSTAFATLGLLGLLACGGFTGDETKPHKATALHYAAPTGLQPTDYHLEVASGQDSNLVLLKLVGPVGVQAGGVGIFLRADATLVTWANPGGTLDPHVKEGTTFALGTGTPALKSKVTAGDLQAGIYQKGAVAPATYAGAAPLLTVALQLNTEVMNGPVTLSATAGGQCKALNSAGTLVPITVKIGALEAR